MKPLAIIGIDPGTTSAYAAIDLKANVIKTNSGKELPLATMISEIITFCHPVIVSTDKAKTPTFVEQIATKLGASVITPAEDLGREEKRLLRGEKVTEDQHQDDALAAALFAHNRLIPKLQRIERFITENHLEKQSEEFTKMAMTQELHLVHLKELLLNPTPENKIFQEALLGKEVNKNNLLRLYQRLRDLREENKRIRQEAKGKKEELFLAKRTEQKLTQKKDYFDKKLDSLLKFKEERIKIQSHEIEKLRFREEMSGKKQVDLLRFIGKAQQYFLVKKIPTLGQKDYQERKEVLQFEEGDYLFVEKPEIFSEKVVMELKQKGILLLTDKNVKSELAMRLVNKEDFVDENEFFALIKQEDIEKKINPAELAGTIIRDYLKKESYKE